jgi:hypothetical protein
MTFRGEVSEHIFTYPWNFTVYLTVRDEEDNNDTDEIIINVEDKKYTKNEISPGSGSWFEWWMILILVAIVELIFILSFLKRKRRKVNKKIKNIKEKAK